MFSHQYLIISKNIVLWCASPAPGPSPDLRVSLNPTGSSPSRRRGPIWCGFPQMDSRLRWNDGPFCDTLISGEGKPSWRGGVRCRSTERPTEESIVPTCGTTRVKRRRACLALVRVLLHNNNKPGEKHGE